MGKRNDSYPTAILGKVDWALENTDYDTVVHIGDMFDKPVVPRRIEHAMCDMIARSQRKWNIVVGTHDIGRGTFETAGKSIGRCFRWRKQLGHPEKMFLTPILMGSTTQLS